MDPLKPGHVARTVALARQYLAEVEYNDWRFLVRLHDTRPYLQIEAPEGVCNVTGKSLVWRGRKWLLSPHMTKSEVVLTAFKAVLTAVEHETREQFKYKGATIFDPHWDVDFLAAAAANPDVTRSEREAA